MRVRYLLSSLVAICLMMFPQWSRAEGASQTFSHI